MANPVYQGYGRMWKNIQRYFRAESNPGAVDDESIADAIWEGEDVVTDLITKSGVHWAIKFKVIEDEVTPAGVEIEAQTRRLFVNSDIGITDFGKAIALSRIDKDLGQISQPLYYTPKRTARGVILEEGSLVAPAGEYWAEYGDVNASGRDEQALIIYNYGTALTGGRLKIEYHYAPPAVQVDWFTEADSSGNVGRIPTLPQKTWNYIVNYAKWVLCEQTGDEARRIGLLQRFKGAEGLDNRLNTWLSSFQTFESVRVEDVYEGE